MASNSIDEAITWLEKANANLDPELLDVDGVRDMLASYARAEKLASYGKTLLAQRLDDAVEVARATGTSVGTAKETLATGKALREADEVRNSFGSGNISLQQATESPKPSRRAPARPRSCCGWPRRRALRCSGRSREGWCWRPSSTAAWLSANTRPVEPKATGTISA